MYKIVIMSSMSGVIQVTSVCSLGTCCSFKINTDAVGFMVTTQLTSIRISDSDSGYVVVLQTFVSEEEMRREGQFTTFT